jgi:hypothetical protein
MKLRFFPLSFAREVRLRSRIKNAEGKVPDCSGTLPAVNQGAAPVKPPLVRKPTNSVVLSRRLGVDFSARQLGQCVIGFLLFRQRLIE